jgi:hypothetical protein
VPLPEVSRQNCKLKLDGIRSADEGARDLFTFLRFGRGAMPQLPVEHQPAFTSILDAHQVWVDTIAGDVESGGPIPRAGSTLKKTKHRLQMLSNQTSPYYALIMLMGNSALHERPPGQAAEVAEPRALDQRFAAEVVT